GLGVRWPFLPCRFRWDSSAIKNGYILPEILCCTPPLRIMLVSCKGRAQNWAQCCGFAGWRNISFETVVRERDARSFEREAGMKSTGRGRAEAALHQGVVERQLAADFSNPSLEWRRIFAETWGTFLLVLVAAGGGVVAAMSGGKVTLGMMVVAPGIMVMAIIYFMGAVSGAHLNPAVTLAFAVRRNFSWKRVPGYIVGQV